MNVLRASVFYVLLFIRPAAKIILRIFIGLCLIKAAVLWFGGDQSGLLYLALAFAAFLIIQLYDQILSRLSQPVAG